MANHAYVLFCLVDQDQVDNLARQFCEGPLKGLFELRTGKDNWRCISYKGDDQLGVEFWITTHKDHGWDDQGNSSDCGSEKEYEDLPDLPAITIRHGHHTEFGWWVDFYWEHYLAGHLGGKIVDEGDDVLRSPKFPYEFPHFRDWVNREEYILPPNTIKEKILRWVVKKARVRMAIEGIKRYPELRKAFYNKE